MKTPYDPVVRLGAREVEALRNALRQEIARVADLARDAEALREHVRTEYALAERSWALRTDHWMRARMAQAERITQARTEAEAGLTQVRAQAITAYGKLRAAERAAETHRERESATQQRKTQAEADDLTSARHLLKLRRKAGRAALGR